MREKKKISKISLHEYLITLQHLPCVAYAYTNITLLVPFGLLIFTVCILLLICMYSPIFYFHILTFCTFTVICITVAFFSKERFILLVCAVTMQYICVSIYICILICSKWPCGIKMILLVCLCDGIKMQKCHDCFFFLLQQLQNKTAFHPQTTMCFCQTSAHSLHYTIQWTPLATLSWFNLCVILPAPTRKPLVLSSVD